MKNKLFYGLCGVIIVASLFIIIKSYIPITNNYSNADSTGIYENSISVDTQTEILLDDKMIDIGNITRDTTIKQNYILYNIGENPLVIYGLNPDCNCTDYEISKKTAMPGDSVIITLLVDMKDKRKGRFMLNTVAKANTPQKFHLLRLQGNITD